VANVTSVLSPTATNEIIFSYSALKLDNGWDDPSKVQQSAQGTNFGNPFGNSQYIPDVVMNFQSEASMWAAQDVDNIFAYNGFARFTDNFTKVLNTHAVKVGGIVERQYKQQNFQHQNNTQLIFAPWGNGSTGNEFADLMVGRPAQAQVGQPSAIGHFVAWNYEFFVQDSWKATKNFTLEYGLRVGKWTNNVETNGLGAIFDASRYNPNAGTYLDAAKTQLNGVAYATEIGDDLTDARPLLVMPRVNFAWDLSGNGSTVVRGGGGIFYNREQGNAQYGIINVAPNSYAVTFDAGNYPGRRPQLQHDRPHRSADRRRRHRPQHDEHQRPRLAAHVPGERVRRPPHPVASHARGGLRRDIRAPHGRAAPDQLGADRDLLQRARGQRGPLQPPPPGRPHRQRRQRSPAVPDPPEREHLRAHRHLQLQRPPDDAEPQTGRFTYLAAYTLSKFKGTVGGDFAQIDPLDPARSYGYLLGDRTHNLAFSWTARLGDPVASNKLGKAFLNGWNLSGISSYVSGQPIRLGFTGDLSTDSAEQAWFGTKDFLGYSRDFSQGGTGAITPTFTCDPTIKGGSHNVGDKVLDLSCVGIPALGQSGPFVSPYNLRAPSRNFHDLTVFKDFRFGQSDRRIQIRAGVFNLFNQAYPIAPAGPGGTDIDLTLEANCNRRVNGVPNGEGGFADNVCDPTGGYTFTSNTQQNFGKIITKRGRRVVEFALAPLLLERAGRLEGGPPGPPFFLPPYNLSAVPQVAAAMRIAVIPSVLAVLAVLAERASCARAGPGRGRSPGPRRRPCTRRVTPSGPSRTTRRRWRRTRGAWRRAPTSAPPTPSSAATRRRSRTTRKSWPSGQRSIPSASTWRSPSTRPHDCRRRPRSSSAWSRRIPRTCARSSFSPIAARSSARMRAWSTCSPRAKRTSRTTGSTRTSWATPSSGATRSSAARPSSSGSSRAVRPRRRAS
jgi:hypothetical protein